MNPRPSKRHTCIYARVRSLVSRHVRCQPAGLRPQPAPCLFHRGVRSLDPAANPLSSPCLLSGSSAAGRHGKLSREGQFSIGFCVFPRIFNEAHRGFLGAQQGLQPTRRNLSPPQFLIHFILKTALCGCQVIDCIICAAQSGHSPCVKVNREWSLMYFSICVHWPLLTRTLLQLEHIATIELKTRFCCR